MWKGCDSSMITRTSPGSKPTCFCTDSSSCSWWKCPSPKFQPAQTPATTSPSHVIRVDVVSGAVDQRVERAAVAVHRAEGKRLVHEVVSHLVAVLLRELL